MRYVILVFPSDGLEFETETRQPQQDMQRLSSLNKARPDPVASALEFIPNKLYYTSVSQQLQVDLYPDTHFFTIDHVLVYINFYADFGPNNISHVYRFIEILGQKMKTIRDKKICLVSSSENEKRANSAFLIASYMMLVYKMTPDEAYKPLQTIHHLLMPYRDAGYGAATYFLSVLDCLKGFYKALQVGLFHIDTFNLEEYEYYEKVENGDFNWITDKFLAIASPKDETSGVMGTGIPINPNPAMQPNAFFQNRMSKKNEPTGRLYPVTRIDNLIKYFKEHNVCTIIRLNNKLYDRKRFVEAGIEHLEMYFPDGSTPPDFILKQFLDLVENRQGAIAVHCKAGLGRTGSLIAAYLMKHYKMTANETIAFLRIVRPGSVVGPQQNWLESMQARMWKMHPAFPLSPTMSLLRPSSLRLFKRFQEHALAYPYHVMSPHSARPLEDEDQDMEDAELLRELSMDQLNKHSQRSTGVRDYFRVSKSANPAHRTPAAKMAEMAIPIQPRKGFAGTQPVIDYEEPLGQDFSSQDRYQEYTSAVSSLTKRAWTPGPSIQFNKPGIEKNTRSNVHTPNARPNVK